MNNEESIIAFQDLISNFFKVIRAERNMFFRKFPFTPAQYDVLHCLSEKNMTLSALSESLLLDSSTLVGIVDRLELKGWVKKKVSPHDRRKNILSITDRGKLVFESVPRFVSESLDEALENLNEDEREIFTELLAKMSGRITASVES